MTHSGKGINARLLNALSALNPVGVGTDLHTPRPGLVDALTCLVCKGLRASLALALAEQDPASAVTTVHSMQTHMIHGHPNDPRNMTNPQGGPECVLPKIR